MKPAYSFRKRLIRQLIAALLASSAIIILCAYLTAEHELDELYDQNMRQIAQIMLAQHDADQSYPEPETQSKATRLRGEEELLIQIWDVHSRQRLYSSHPAIAFPWMQESGMRRTVYEGRKWRYFSQENGSIRVQLSQPLEKRRKAILEVSSPFLYILLLQIPLFGWLIWIMVGHAIRPIERVAEAIRSRDSRKLQPIAKTDLPQEIQPMVEALNDLLARLEQSITVQRRFTADAAHELRTPLTAVQLQLDVLKRSRSESDRKDAIEHLSQGVKRSIHVVRQLLSLAHNEPEAMQKPEPVDLAALCANVTEQHHIHAQTKNIALAFLPPAAGEYIIKGSKNALETLLGNLLDNAIRYTPKDGNVQVALYNDAESVVLEVADDGRGIPESEREQVFRRFYRVLGSEESGTGLGLAIVQQIAVSHHATVTLQSGLNGHGLGVRVTFPLA